MFGESKKARRKAKKKEVWLVGEMNENQRKN